MLYWLEMFLFFVQDCLIKENPCNALNIPELRVAETDFPTDDVRNMPPFSLYSFSYSCFHLCVSYFYPSVQSSILEKQFPLQEPEARPFN